MTDPVFHFTNTARLPWIIEDGELRPSQNRIAGFPIDFLWATTNPLGDRTSSAQAGLYRDIYRQNGIQLIRFTLPGEAFSNWREMIAKSPKWTERHISLLEGTAREMGESGIENWRCRIDAFAISGAIAVHAKTVMTKWEADHRNA